MLEGALDAHGAQITAAPASATKAIAAQLFFPMGTSFRSVSRRGPYVPHPEETMKTPGRGWRRTTFGPPVFPIPSNEGPTGSRRITRVTARPNPRWPRGGG